MAEQSLIQQQKRSCDCNTLLWPLLGYTDNRNGPIQSISISILLPTVFFKLSFWQKGAQYSFILKVLEN